MFNKFILSVCSLALLVGCKKDDNNSPDPNKGEILTGSFFLETSVKNGDQHRSGASYLQLITNPSGVIDNKKAEQVGLSSGRCAYGNEVYVFDVAPSPDSKKAVTKYRYNPAANTFAKDGVLEISSASDIAFNLVKASDTKAYMPLFFSGTVWIINPQTMQKTSEIDISSYAHQGNTPKPGYGIVRDGYFYLPLNQITDQWMPYDDYQQSDVLVINTTTDKVESLIAEKTTGLAFPSLQMEEGMVFQNESHDIYIACAGYFGYNPANTKCGFICIPNGSKDFNTARSWDISTTVIEGLGYKPTSIYNCWYIGGGKALAYVAVAELIDPKNLMTSKNAVAVLVDLNAKSIKKIEGIEPSSQEAISLRPADRYYLIGNSSASKRGFYRYDPSTGKATFAFATEGLPNFIHQFKK